MTYDKQKNVQQQKNQQNKKISFSFNKKKSTNKQAFHSITENRSIILNIRVVQKLICLEFPNSYIGKLFFIGRVSTPNFLRFTQRHLEMSNCL